MALTATQQLMAWNVLQNSIFARWPQFRTAVLPALSRRPYAPGDIVYSPGSDPLYLYIVLHGRVVETVSEGGGEPWLKRELGPGQFFGQQALFREKYEATARVPINSNGAELLLMTAAQLRVGLEAAPQLYEELLHEDRASRLRRIPLFRQLRDENIRQLAQVVEERDFAKNEAIPVDEMPGIWIVDRGQVGVTGPIQPHPNWEEWRLTVGNFFIARGKQTSSLADWEMPFGLNAAADTAEAYLPSHLFYLPAAHVSLLTSMFPEVGQLIHQPMDLTPVLEDATLLRNLNPEQCQHLAQFAAWEYIPANQNITTQGNTGHSYVVLRQGAALITAFDNQGRQRPRSKQQPGYAYGGTSLIEGRMRDASVRAVPAPRTRSGPGLPGADVVTLDRRDLRHAIAERPDLWPPTVPLVKDLARTKDERPPFDWMQEGEMLRWVGRPHPLWLLGPLLWVVVALLVVAGIAFIIAARSGPGAALTTTLLLLGFGVAPLTWFIVANYLDDYYALTDRRIIRRDRLLFQYETLGQAPVQMIQDITTQSTFWGNLLGYGDVIVRTAGREGTIKLSNVGRPKRLEERLRQTASEAVAAERGKQKEEIRRGLIKDLGLSLPIPQRQRALGDVPLPTQPRLPAWAIRRLERIRAHRRIAAWRAVRARRTAARAATAKVRKSKQAQSAKKTGAGGSQPAANPQGEIVWHKHWVNAVQRTGLQFLLMVASAILIVVFLFPVQSRFGVDPTPFVSAFGFSLIFSAVWFAWRLIDYWNDKYIVTDERIIDIEQRPLSLNANRRVAELDKVQNVVTRQKGLMATIFKYGDVVVSTAAADAGFTFNMVPNPQQVTSVVFQKVAALRMRQQQQAAIERRREMIEALSVYDQLKP